MSKIDSKANERKRMRQASKNLEELLRRIRPFIKKPVEEPIERKPWVISNPGCLSHHSAKKPARNDTGLPPYP